MSIFTRVTYTEAQPDVKVLYDDICDSMKLSGHDELPNWATYLGASPDILASSWQLIKTGIVKNPLPLLLKELLMVTVASVHNSPYCQARHCSNAMKLTDLSYPELIEIVQGQTNGLIPEKYHHALKAVRELNKTECVSNDHIFEHLHGIGFSHTETTHLVQLISVAWYLSFFTVMALLPIDDKVKSYLSSRGVPFKSFSIALNQS